MSIKTEIHDVLRSAADEEYKKFNSSLLPTVPAETVIGVRTPGLRKFAKELTKRKDLSEFLTDLPHKYFEENQLHAFLISSMKDFNDMVRELEAFLPYVDNWATCDQMNPKIFSKHLPELLDLIKVWIKSEKTYTVRFGLNMLMTYFLDDEFTPEYLELAASVESQDYYVNMMQAWFFATALAKQYDSVLPYITEKKLSPWVHNKTIQKARESFRITKEQKEYLNQYKILEK